VYEAYSHQHIFHWPCPLVFSCAQFCAGPSFVRRSEKKIEDVLGEDQFGFRRGREIRDAIGTMRITAERTLVIDEELCICFIDCRKHLTV